MNSFKKFVSAENSFLLALPTIAWQILFFIVPLLFVLLLAFFEHTPQALFAHFSYQPFLDVFTLKHFFIIFRSLSLACVTAVSSLLFAYPLAYFLSYKTARYRFFFLFLLTVPFLVNILVQVYAWFFILDKQGIINNIALSLGLISEPINFLESWISVNIVMFHVYLPFMVLPLFSAIEKIDHRLIEASLDLGASFFETVVRVLVPLSMPGIKSGFFLVLVTSFGEYALPALMGGNRVFYVGTLISEYIFIGHDWGTGAAFLCMSCLVLLGAIYVWNLFFDAITFRSEQVHL